MWPAPACASVSSPTVVAEASLSRRRCVCFCLPARLCLLHCRGRQTDHAAHSGSGHTADSEGGDGDRNSSIGKGHTGTHTALSNTVLSNTYHSLAAAAASPNGGLGGPARPATDANALVKFGECKFPYVSLYPRTSSARLVYSFYALSSVLLCSNHRGTM